MTIWGGEKRSVGAYGGRCSRSRVHQEQVHQAVAMPARVMYCSIPTSIPSGCLRNISKQAHKWTSRGYGMDRETRKVTGAKRERRRGGRGEIRGEDEVERSEWSGREGGGEGKGGKERRCDGEREGREMWRGAEEERRI
ncbi:hypothetical protein Tco_1507107 [Tanacetum coccineum]